MRRIVIGVMVSVVILGVGLIVGLTLATIVDQGRELRDLKAVQVERSADVDALRDQVIELDGEPVVGDPGEQGERGDRGRRGPQGPRGPRGLDGRDGADGRDGLDGVDGIPGEQGPAGPEGDVGPQGEPGPAGPQGDPGPAGPQGEPGTDGVDGQPPESFTFDVGPRTYTCTDPDGDGHYDCTAGPPNEEP